MSRIIDSSLAFTAPEGLPVGLSRREVSPAVAPGPAGIAFEAVGKTFPARRGQEPVQALADIDLQVPDGSIYGVIGRSGAGKWTLVRRINLLERPTSGRVLVGGQDVAALDAAALRAARRRVGMVFQHFNLLSSRTVYDNVALPLELQGLGRGAIFARVDPLLDLVGLTDKRDRYPAELSGGQKQRVGIARALATRPRVLLCDEATSALDPETTKQILALVADVNRRFGITVVLITHEMTVIKEICQRVAVLEGGRLVEEGEVFDVLTRPKTEIARRFVADVTAASLPAWLARRLSAEPSAGAQSVLRLAFSGPGATLPVLSRTARRLGIDFNILHGQIDTIQDRPFGTLVVSVAGQADLATHHLENDHVRVERLGFVA